MMFIIVPHNQQQCIKRESSIHSRTPKNISCHVYTLCSPSLTWADACIKETIAQSDFMDFILLFAVAVVGGVLVVSSVFFRFIHCTHFAHFYSMLQDWKTALFEWQLSKDACFAEANEWTECNITAKKNGSRIKTNTLQIAVYGVLCSSK